MPRAIFANITWNRKGWAGIDINPKAGHEKVRDKAGHESLNFDFDKKGIDTDEWVYGYFQRTNDPAKFAKNGLIFFYSKDLEKKERPPFIVGIYGQAETFKKKTMFEKYEKFENNDYWANMKAKRDFTLKLSAPFSNKFIKETIVGQGGFNYLKDDEAKELLCEIIKHRVESEDKTEVPKLKRLLADFTSEKSNYLEGTLEKERFLEEQEWIKRIKDLERIKEIDQRKDNLAQSKNVSVRHYERDTELSALLKEKYNHTCQICGIQTFETKNGNHYTESHHIHPVSAGGPDVSENIVIVCPNCHNKFDKGSEAAQMDVYRILKEIKFSVDFDVLKKHRVISDSIFSKLSD